MRDRALPLAAVTGLAVGAVVYGGLVAAPFVALGTATVYAGAAYFYLAYDLSLGATAVEFDDRTDKLGYAVGLFGVSVSPLALAGQYGGDRVVFVVWITGVVAFLLFAPRADDRGA